MSATTPGTAAAQLEIPNKFTLHGEQHTQITYFPMGSGPIISGKTEAGPKMEYTGEEGNFTFSGNQLESVDSPLGSLISVTLRPNVDAGALIFTLVLPKVSEAQGSKTESFKTFGVKTKTRGFVASAGADRTYTVLHLQGVAEIVELPN